MFENFKLLKMCRVRFPIILFFSMISSLYINSCTACNGYKMHLISVENCGNDNVVTIDGDFTANLSPDCMLTTVGCLHSKGFKEAKVKFSFAKDGHELLTGHPDICNVLDHKNEQQKQQLEAFGFPTDCPVPEGKKCFDGTKKVDVSKFKDVLSMAVGEITAKYDVTHDTGKSCAVVKFEIKHED